MPRDDQTPFKPSGHRMYQRPRRRYTGPVVVLLLMLLAAAAAVWIWWSGTWPPHAPLVVPPAPTAAVPPEPSTEPMARFPLEEAPAPVDVTAALSDLFGRDAVLRLLQVGDFPRRFVATVDSLGREHSPPQMWPVVPPAGRFGAEPRGEIDVIASANARRYVPLIALAESLDPRRATDLYRGLYPQLQAAYQALGFQNRYFNDRMIEVLDLLLASPEPEGPVRVRLFEIKGPIPDPRPWVRWEFVDPQLQALPAGQKIMVRMGPQNERRAKKALAAFRAELVRGQPATR